MLSLSSISIDIGTWGEIMKIGVNPTVNILYSRNTNTMSAVVVSRTQLSRNIEKNQLVENQ